MAHEEKLEKVQEALKEGEETTRKITDQVSQAVKDNPWPFIAGAAIFSFLLGFFVKGSRRD